MVLGLANEFIMSISHLCLVTLALRVPQSYSFLVPANPTLRNPWSAGSCKKHHICGKVCMSEHVCTCICFRNDRLIGGPGTERSDGPGEGRYSDDHPPSLHVK